MDTLLQNVAVREDGTIDLNELMRRLAERFVNDLMDIQVEELFGGVTPRNGYRERTLNTVVGPITLRIPKLREGTYFPSDVIRPYSRTDRALIGAIAEMYVNGVSTRKVERVAAEMGFEQLSSSQVSRMCATLDEEVAGLRSMRFSGMRFPYLWLDATYMKCRTNGHVASRAVVTAIAAGEDGSRQFVGLDVVDVESYASWKPFLLDLRRRGVDGVCCVTSDAHDGLVRAIQEVFPGAAWQRCIVHFERNLADLAPGRLQKAKVLAAAKAVFKEADPAMVREAYRQAASGLEAICPKASRAMEDAELDVLAYLDFPQSHRMWLRTNNIQERANREIKRRTKVVQSFPSEGSMIRLVGAVLVEVNEEWLAGKFIDRDSLQGVLRRERAHGAASDEVKAKAFALVKAAIEAAGRAA